LGLALLPGNAVSQQKSLKDQVIGSWSFVSVVNVRPDGTREDLYGGNPVGLVIFDANGRYASVLTGPSRLKFASNNRMVGTPEENKAAAQGSLSHFGAYTVNDADRTITFNIERSSYANWDGNVQKRTITSLTADEFKYIVPTSTTGSGTAEVVLKRAKQRSGCTVMRPLMGARVC
jgi:hypothetical protein